MFVEEVRCLCHVVDRERASENESFLSAIHPSPPQRPHGRMVVEHERKYSGDMRDGRDKEDPSVRLDMKAVGGK